MKVTTDVDIDVADRDKLLANLWHIDARIDRENEYVKHNTGAYFQPIPRDPLTNIATIDHKDASELGYFKIDFLNNSVYKNVRSEEHLTELVNTKPQWELLQHADIIKNLAHIGDYSDLVIRLQPDSLSKLAMILAIIRPAKAHLRDKEWDEIEKGVWMKPESGYYFKKSHAHAFALSIIVQLNLMVEHALAHS